MSWRKIIMIKNQLYIKLSNFEIFDYYSYNESKLKTLNIDNCPILFFPNHVPCFEANSYILNQLSKGLSQRNGGTLNTYASNISIFLKFCYLNNITSFLSINNESFVDFINYIKSEKKIDGNKSRTSNQVITIGQRCIDFLLYVQDLYNYKNLIGVGSEFQIRLLKNEKSNPKTRVRNVTYNHSSFPHKVSTLKKRPISIENCLKIRSYVAGIKQMDIQKRNLCLLDCLELTGARRDEIRQLKVQDISTALKSQELCPLLKFETLKTKIQQNYRMVPVPRSLLNSLSNYIRHYRRKIIANTIGIKNDHGLVFISHITGKPLSVDTLTTYMYNWSVNAGTNTKVSLHQYRHKFITEKLFFLIKEFQIENKYKFREAFFEIAKLKLIIQQWTGHTSVDSLDVYIDYAFLEDKNINKITENVILKNESSLLSQKIKQLETAFNDQKITKEIFLNELENTINDYKIQSDL